MTYGDARQSGFVVSRRHNQDLFFDGYFFEGPNYVSGSYGLAEYSGLHGFVMRPGLDGCYIFGRRTGAEIVFGADYSGYKTVFYYHDGEEWAVGESLWAVVQELRALGVAVVPDYAQLGAICSTNSTNNQMFSWNSVARGVKLLPRGAKLRVLEDRVIVDAQPAKSESNYLAGLQDHISLWLDRFATLLCDERLELSIDLTGGVDSRTNFALAQRVQEELGQSTLPPRFTCSGVPGVSPDATVATELCALYGSTLNPGNRILPHRVEPREGYDLWRNQSLGMYYPLVIPATRRHASRVHMSGGGGEIHRDYYARATAREFFRGHMTRNLYPWLGFEAGEVASRDAQAAAEGRDESPLRANYREFRHRLHSGRSPRQSISFTPLDSRTAERANRSAHRGSGFDAHFNYDIIASLNPALLDVSFDRPTKSPSEEIRAALPPVMKGCTIQAGRAYGELETGASPGVSFSAADRIAPFVDAVEEAVEFSSVRTFLGAEIVESARSLVATVAGGGNFGNPVHGFPVSAVLSAAMVAPEINSQ